ncbi:hypothetical protein DL762_003531 [Monosporascus cannonballus]|uniref:Ketoreductase (KR) domain-containing protein n=1 Tax=Monosporascus cannonballus TaxID=155416 RepID=A0ABY0HA90_9PEZI|nr:hypothetical protein DL762_003531 [Monosporascus cannonballus]RYO96519.1 hypothetical protein DL763_003138 [Monosporascus cannonballus]
MLCSPCAEVNYIQHHSHTSRAVQPPAIYTHRHCPLSLDLELLSLGAWSHDPGDLRVTLPLHWVILLFTLIIGLMIIITLTIVMTEFREMARVTLFGSPNNASRGSGATAFEPARDIRSLVGKVVLITGAAGDLGRQTAIELARYGRLARIYVADLPRDDDTKKALARQITYEAYGDSQSDMEVAGPHTEIRFLELDLSSLETVRKCAADFVAQKKKRLDILILNAGIIRMRPGETRKGYEIHFGINYLGHALLSRLLVPKMLLTTQQPGLTYV